MKQIIPLLLLLFVLSAAYPQGGRLIENPLREVPKWVRNEFSSRHLDQRYRILYKLYPHVLRADFNGDRKRDVAIQVEENSSGKLGIAIFHVKKAQALYVPVTIVGAGKPAGNSGDDLKWVEVWSLQHRGGSSSARKAPMPEMVGEGIRLEKRGGASGLIFWDGKKYSWYTLKK